MRSRTTELFEEGQEAMPPDAWSVFQALADGVQAALAEV